jgi:hypothetical protein
MDEPVGVGVWRKKDKGGNWVSEKSEFDPEASKKRADHLDHFLKLPSFQQRYELEVRSRDSVRDARKCAGQPASPTPPPPPPPPPPPRPAQTNLAECACVCCASCDA